MNYLVYFDGERARIAAPRVVARAGKGLDVAVIHVETTLPHVFAWSATRRTGPREMAVSVGRKEMARITDQVRYYGHAYFAGRITAVRRSAEGALAIHHDLPLRRGDSGGPLATTDGMLIGINTKGTLSMGKQTAVGVRPDLSWVARVIQEDRSRSARERSAPHQQTPKSRLRKGAARLVISL